MITTRFGSEIKVVGRSTDKSDWLVCVRVQDKTTHEYHISDLRADGGIEEIEKAIEEVKVCNV